MRALQYQVTLIYKVTREDYIKICNFDIETEDSRYFREYWSSKKWGFYNFGSRYKGLGDRAFIFKIDSVIAAGLLHQ